MDLVWVAALTPRESRMGRSASPLVAFAFLGLAPSCVTESTSLVRFLFSSSSATSTRSATSSPKSPTCESELTDRVVAFWRLRSTLERGTRVNRSSSILARASMRANSRLAKKRALHVALVAAELLGSLPELLREFLRRCEKNQFSVSVGGGLVGGKYGACFGSIPVSSRR